MNETKAIKRAIQDFNKKYKKKSLFAKIKQHKCKTCEYAYIQGSIFACEYGKSWNGYKCIRPLKLICFNYKKRRK